MSAEPQTLHFLVVDDNEDIREAFCRLVQRAGHLASIARDGLEALDSLQRESFDVMLLLAVGIETASSARGVERHPYRMTLVLERRDDAWLIQQARVVAAIAERGQGTRPWLWRSARP